MTAPPVPSVEGATTVDDFVEAVRVRALAPPQPAPAVARHLDVASATWLPGVVEALGFLLVLVGLFMLWPPLALLLGGAGALLWAQGVRRPDGHGSPPRASL